MANRVDPDETAYHEPSHQDLHCLQKICFGRITRTRLYNFDSLNALLYSKTGVYRGKHYFSYFCSKTSIVVLVRMQKICFGCITRTRLYNFDLLKPHFYIVKLGFTGVNIIFLISAQKHRLWYSLEPPRRGGSNEYLQPMF